MKVIKYFLYIVILLAAFAVENYGQNPSFNPEVYTKPLPDEITVSGQPADFKFTTHLVNIKVPTDSAKIWNPEMEKNYIQRLFNYIDDVDCLVLNYSGIGFTDSVTYGGLNGFSYEFNIQNAIQNIGLTQFNNSYQYNSNKLLQIIRLSAAFGLRPVLVTHELFHLWNTFVDTAEYWLMDPSHHTGLVEDTTSVFEVYRNSFRHVKDSIYTYKQYSSQGFVGKLEGYFAGLWDMPDHLRTLKNYYHYYQSSDTWSSDFTYLNVQVKADSIVDLNKEQLLEICGGERVPNYLNSKKDFSCAVVVFSLNDFLDDNDLKAFHYASVLNEFEEPTSEYCKLYDEVFGLHANHHDAVYGSRFLNPYHASFKKLHFHTRLFNDNATAVSDESPVPSEYELSQNYPNPFNPTTIINYSVPEQCSVKIVVMDALGREVSTLVGEVKPAGNYRTNFNGDGLSSGIYFYKLTAGNFTQTKKMILLR